jgi:formylglycine-generating enzyme
MILFPAGTFVMGSEHGEPDERPVHHVSLGDFWLVETAISWARFCDLSGWQPPPAGRLREPERQGGTGSPRFPL